MLDESHLNTLGKLDRNGFQMEFHSHSKAILNIDYPTALRELEDVLGSLSIPIQSLVRGGGGEAEVTQGLRRRLAHLGWRRHSFEIKTVIDGVERQSISHHVDHVRTIGDGKLAMEIEWNNKDAFFDRDLENFRRLHGEAAISVGVVITRGRDHARTRLAQAWSDVFCSDKYGQATTHWRKLQDRVRRGVGSPCPLLLLGIPDTVIRF